MADNQKYHTIRLRVNGFQFSKFEEARKMGITQKMIVQALCQPSAEIQIIVFDKKKKQSIELPKGFLCNKKTL